MATRKQRQAAGKKRAAANTPHDELIAALEVEKAGYEQRNLADRAKAVQAQITKHKAAAKKSGTSGNSSGQASGSDAAEKAAGAGTSPQSNRGSAKASTGDGDTGKGDEKAAAASSGS